MTEFKETKTFKTVFGAVETTYVAPYTEEANIFNGLEEKQIDSHYKAVMLDGDFNGWRGTGANRDKALADLLKQVAERYAHDIVEIC